MSQVVSVPKNRHARVYSSNRGFKVIAHISIGVKDVESSKRFYDQALQPLGEGGGLFAQLILFLGDLGRSLRLLRLLIRGRIALPFTVSLALPCPLGLGLARLVRLIL